MKTFSKKNMAILSLAALFVACKTTKDYVMIDGVCWATHNLAAHGKFVENPQDYGALFQWGRQGDGHEQRTSVRYPNDNTSSENGIVSGVGNFDANGQIVSSHAAFGKFIKQNDFPCDWRNPHQDNLWNSGTASNPIKTVNDPCPPGWRMPTSDEFYALVSAAGSRWTDNWNGTGAAGRVFGTAPNTLFLPAAGNRTLYNGAVDYTFNGYWSSTARGTGSWSLVFTDGKDLIGDGYRALGLSVRCVSE